jgi:hypothetical protein
VEHVVWIFMENHHRRDVMGNAAAPFERSLAKRCGSAADYRHVARPSLPNYLGATSGETWGVRDDAPPADHPIVGDNVFRQVRRAGRRAMTFAEGMPAPCTLLSTGRYAVKHNPAAYYRGADDRAACQLDDVPLGDLRSGPFGRALASGEVPAFAALIPDLCHDTHDCSVADGDRWLAAWVGMLVADRAYLDGSTALFVVWDEPTPMPFLAIAPVIRPGATVTQPVDHYSLLRTTEELLGIDAYLGAASRASSMRPALGL